MISLKQSLFLTGFVACVFSQAKAADFVCSGRMGEFVISTNAESASIVLKSSEGAFCDLPQDQRFDPSERSFFQVKGYYDLHPEPEVRKLDLPELVSPEGYLAFHNTKAEQGSDCQSLKDIRFRNLYLKEEMLGQRPDNFENTVISVFIAPQGWPVLYVNSCELVESSPAKAL